MQCFHTAAAAAAADRKWVEPGRCKGRSYQEGTWAETALKTDNQSLAQRGNWNPLATALESVRLGSGWVSAACRTTRGTVGWSVGNRTVAEGRGTGWRTAACSGSVRREPVCSERAGPAVVGLVVAAGL